MQITFINNTGSGFADTVEVEDHMTVEALFKEKMDESDKPEDFLIRVNREHVPKDYVLHEGDRVSITPIKIHGARAA
jgi:sulfur carrier protein ThiS